MSELLPRQADARRVTVVGTVVRTTPHGWEVSFAAGRPVWLDRGLVDDVGHSDVVAGDAHVFTLPAPLAREKGIG